MISGNIAAQVLERYREMRRLAEQSFLGEPTECLGGEYCLCTPNPWQPHKHYYAQRSYTEAELQEVIRSLALIHEQVESKS